MAYMDESGIHRGSDVFAIGGWVAPADAWTKFEAKWRKVLGKYRGSVPEEEFAFHAADCEAFRVNFLGWTKDKRDAFKDELTSIIVDSPLFGAGFSTDRRSHDSFTGMAKWAHAKMGMPFTPILMLAVTWLARQSRSFLGEGGKVSFVFDLQKEFAGRAQFVFRTLQRAPDFPVPGTLGSLTFANSVDLVPIQAADLLAYEAYKETLRQMGDKTRRPRRTFERLASIDRVMFSQTNYTFHDKKSRPRKPRGT